MESAHMLPAQSSVRELVIIACMTGDKLNQEHSVTVQPNFPPSPDSAACIPTVNMPGKLGGGCEQEAIRKKQEDKQHNVKSQEHD